MSDQTLIERTAQALRMLGTGHAPKYRIERLRVDVSTTRDATQLRAAIESFAPLSDWLQACSAVRLWEGGWHEGDGLPIAGEFAHGARSLHLRHGAAGWTLVTLSEGEGNEVIAYDARFESVAAVQGQAVPGHGLCYRVYLRREGELGLRPFQARFTGFGEE